jgi:hypothetical protein
MPPRAQRFVAIVGLALWFALAFEGGSTPAFGQQTQRAGLERGVAVIHPDTVRAGEVFELALTAVSRERVQFPALLPLPDEIEQAGPPHLEEDGSGTWRAVYPLVAWKSGHRPLPVVRVPVVGGSQERQLEIRPPAVTVASVLPAESEPVRLLPPRVPEETGRFPWPWLLALLLAALLAREILRGRRDPPAPVSPIVETGQDPYEEARELLQRLRRRAMEEPFEAAILYDEMESIVRQFLGRTRDWPEERPVRQALGTSAVDSSAVTAHDTEGIFRAVRRALPARFGALQVSREALLTDVDSMLAWLSQEEAA